jgi:NAD(P)-dependent dehydrogenase (short-subunit alcohol dehydrogenase family)
MPTHDLSGVTALVTGASRGFGRATALALAASGAYVVGVARDRDRLAELAGKLGDAFVPEVADVTDPVRTGQLLDAHRPGLLVLNAGATPLMRPIHHHTWETFSRNWDVDVRHAFGWTREAMLLPLEPGSTVLALSSTASRGGSPHSGGYSGSKAMIRFLTAYAADESERAGLGLRFLSLSPSLTPVTGLGTVGVGAYARRSGRTLAEFTAGMGPLLTAEGVADAVVELAADHGHAPGAYQVTGAGLAEFA